LQESKLVLISSTVVHSLLGCPHVDWCYSAFRGASGGIFLMWYRRIVERIEECVGDFSVACLFRNVKDGFS
jgi:hypothetical protein